MFNLQYSFKEPLKSILNIVFEMRNRKNIYYCKNNDNYIRTENLNK